MSNTVFTYQDLAFSDCTPLLADSIQRVLAKGLVLEHSSMTVVSAQEGRSFYDPIAKHPQALERSAIYRRDPRQGSWSVIGQNSQIDDLAIHLANSTPWGSRYGLMVDMLERLATHGLIKRHDGPESEISR